MVNKIYSTKGPVKVSDVKAEIVRNHGNQRKFAASIHRSPTLVSFALNGQRDLKWIVDAALEKPQADRRYS